jgi:hypothetical protein
VIRGAGAATLGLVVVLRRMLAHRNLLRRPKDYPPRHDLKTPGRKWCACGRRCDLEMALA